VLSASGLLTFSQLLLQIINKVLRTFLCEEFARFVGHVRFLAEEIQLPTRREFPVYKKACFVDRPIRLATEEGCQAPPFGDLLPCLFNAAAIDRSVVGPCD
jgi:hypothetical protein